jgi:hypothetical protein
MPETATQPTDPHLDRIRARHAAAEGGGWYLAHGATWEPGTVRATISGYPRTIAVMDFRGWKADANRDLVLNAHSDIGYLLRDRAQYADRETMAARIRQLELALGSAVGTLRAAAIRINAGQTPDPHKLRDSADVLEQITADCLAHRPTTTATTADTGSKESAR